MLEEEGRPGRLTRGQGFVGVFLFFLQLQRPRVYERLPLEGRTHEEVAQIICTHLQGIIAWT